MARLGHICGWCKHFPVCRVLHKIGDDIVKITIGTCRNFEDTRSS